jgi:hypothetical protein
VRLLEGYPRERANRAARRALHFGCLNYAGIKRILVKALDLEPLPEEQPSRAWSQGAAFARKPTDTILTIQEKIHGTHR